MKLKPNTPAFLVARTFPWEWLTFALFAVYLVYKLFTHTPWCDEAQSFLLVRDLSYPQLIAQLKIEGHPWLWYTLLFPFIKLGAPIIIQNIISSLCGLAAAFLILFRSPLPRPLNILFLLASPFLFQYSVVGRPYALIGLIFIALLLLHPQRTARPLLYGLGLATLVSLNLYSAILAGALLASDGLQWLLKGTLLAQLRQRSTLITWGLFIAAAALMLTLLWPGAHYAQYIQGSPNAAKPAIADLPLLSAAQTFFHFAYPIAPNSTPYILELLIPLFLQIIFYATLLGYGAAFTFTALRSGNPHAHWALGFFGIYFGVTLCFLFFAQTFAHHGGMFLLAILATYWLANPQKSMPPLGRASFTPLLTILALGSLLQAGLYCVIPFSNAPAAAAAIRAQGLDRTDTLLVAIDNGYSHCVLPFLKNIRQTKTVAGYHSFFPGAFATREDSLPLGTPALAKLLTPDTAAYRHVLLMVAEERFWTHEGTSRTHPAFTYQAFYTPGFANSFQFNSLRLYQIR